MNMETPVSYWDCSRCGRSIPIPVKHCPDCSGNLQRSNGDWQNRFPDLDRAVNSGGTVAVWIEGGVCFQGVPLRLEDKTVRLLSNPTDPDGPTIDIQISKIAALVVQHRQSERIQDKEELNGAVPPSSEIR